MRHWTVALAPPPSYEQCVLLDCCSTFTHKIRAHGCCLSLVGLQRVCLLLRCSARAKLPPNVDLEMTFPLVDGVQSYKPNFAVEEDNHDNSDEKLPGSQSAQGTDQQKVSNITMMCLLCLHTSIVEIITLLIDAFANIRLFMHEQ